MARMQGMLAMQTGQKMSAAEAAETAIEALRASTGPGEVHAAAHLLIALFSMMISRGQRLGPFKEAEEAVRAALASHGTDDWALTVYTRAAICAATGMQVAAGDEGLRAASRQALADAEEALPGPMPTSRWYASARVLFTWAAARGLRSKTPNRLLSHSGWRTCSRPYWLATRRCGTG